MKPEIVVRFNGGSPVLTIEMHGYLWPKEAIEHAFEVIRMALEIFATRDPAHKTDAQALAEVVKAAVDWQEDPSTAADTALHKALNAYTDRCEARARAGKAKP